MGTSDLENYDVEIERAVLGVMLYDQAAMLEVLDILKPDDFYLEAHRVIFDWVQWLASEGRPFDVLLLTREMKEHGVLESIGGGSYLGDLMSAPPDTPNARYWAEKVRDLSISRELVKLAREVISKASSTSASDLIDMLSSRVIDISRTKSPPRMMKIGDAASAVVREALAMADGKSNSVVVRTGIEAVDNSVFMRHGQLVVLAGATSSGKSSLALQIADNVAKSGGKVAYFSPEMSREEMATRELSERTGFYITAIERGATLDHLARERLSRASIELAGLPLWVDDSPGLTPTEIRGRARQIQLQHGLNLVVVDYLQMVKSSTRNRSREQEVAEISRDLKLAARYLSVPMLVCAQLSRKHIDERRQPHLQDLRESGAIENDADTVLMLHRPSREDPKTLIFVRKQRQGPLGAFAAMFDPTRMRFNNVVRGDGQ